MGEQFMCYQLTLSPIESRLSSTKFQKLPPESIAF
jgi:hypothetical protein